MAAATTFEDPPPVAADAKACARAVPDAAPRWVRRQRMTVLVDSVLLGGLPALRSRMSCWRPRKFGRPALMVKAAERELRARRRVAPLVVIGLGYNSLFQRNRRRYGYWAGRWDREAKRLLRTLRRRGARQFVWVTLREPKRRNVPPRSQGGELGRYSWYFPYVNERLRLLDRRRDDLVLADWRRVSDRRGLTYDSIHLNPRGAALMARTIQRAVRRQADLQTPRRGEIL